MNLQYLESFPNTFKKIDFIKKKKKELKSPMDFVATFIVCIHVFHIHIFSITLIVGHRRKHGQFVYDPLPSGKGLCGLRTVA